MDVLVVGSGPAALALAGACGAAGLGVRVLGGADLPWTPNYGVWVDELRELGLDGYLAHAWEDTRVVYADGAEQRLGRSYGRIARQPLRTHLLARCRSYGVDVRWRKASAVVHDAVGSTVTDDGGEVHQATIVVDASGHEPAFVRRHGAPTSFQTAVGMRVRVPGHPWDPRCFTMMDWTPVDEEDGPSPTFLYVMPFGPEQVFVEETSLLGQAVPFEALQRLLGRRLRRMGVEPAECSDVERCWIPMNPPVPTLDQRVLGFGAAASMVHPATGYQLTGALQTAPVLAATLADGLGRGERPDDVVRRGWRVMWSVSTLTARELALYGAEVIAAMDRFETSNFFRTFMGLPPALRNGYLRQGFRAGAVSAAMWAVFVRGDRHLRRAVLRGGTGLLPSLWRAAWTGNGRHASWGAS